MLEYIIKTDHNEYDPLPMNSLPPYIIPLPILSQHSHTIYLSILLVMGFIKLLDKGGVCVIFPMHSSSLFSVCC